MNATRHPPSVAIITPVHRGDLDATEKQALALQAQHLGHYDRYLVYPRGLTFTWDTKGYLLMPLSKRRFQSIQSYNHMCLDPSFYKKFLAYDYVLICQTDAYVLSDALPEWCAAGYAYVGAPWIKRRFYVWQNSISKHVFKKNLYHDPQYFKWDRVGNGGFSLRHVPTMITMLQHHCGSAPDWRWLLPHFEWKKKIRLLRLVSAHQPRTLGRLFRLLATQTPFHHSHGEDVLWSLLDKRFPEFKVPPPERAAYFCTENTTLKPFMPKSMPFGIHGRVTQEAPNVVIKKNWGDDLNKCPSVAIVMPTHQPSLSPREQPSADRIRQHLGQYDCYLVYPRGLQFTWNTDGFIHKALSKRRFKSLKAYNEMCLDPSFYKHFSAYDYILIVQSDAYIISNQLPFWCRAGFSYVGAPWVKLRTYKKWQHSINKRLGKKKAALEDRYFRWTYVGSGGLSLRHVPSFITALNQPCKRWSGWWWLMRHLDIHNKMAVIHHVFLKRPHTIGRLLRRICGQTPHLYGHNEDFFFALLALHDPTFNTPSAALASTFAAEISYAWKLPVMRPLGMHGYIPPPQTIDDVVQQHWPSKPSIGTKNTQSMAEA